MSQTRAGQSFVRLSKVLNLLHAHPGGLRVGYLAEQVGVPEKTLRSEILDFYAADTLGMRPDTIVFVSASGEEDDPTAAEMVRVVSDQPSAELGVELLSVQDWLRVFQKASQIAQIQPDDTHLREAVDIIEERILAGMPEQPDTDVGSTVAAAIRDRQGLRLEYSRAWQPGINTYEVDPVRMVQTSRGWELDAALPDGQLRTFILDRIRSVTVTDRTFEVPEGIDAELAAQRRATSVDLVVPLGYQWAVDRYAESSRVTDQDEGDVSITAEFLPPVADRVGLVLITAPDSFVVAPEELNDAGAEMARRLLDHHGLGSGGTL